MLNLKNKHIDHHHHDINNNNKYNLNPSFSSTLLDQIYRSIDQQGDTSTKSPEMRFFRETTAKKQNNNVVGGAALGTRRRRPRDHDHDVTCFSSSSLSSDYSTTSSSSSFSDTESSRSRASSSSCFAPPPRPKPVRNSASFRYEEQGNRSNNRDDHRRFNSFRHDSKTAAELGVGDNNEEGSLIKSKSRALKIYNNLKKVKQPISPGGKITSFLNSIFAGSKKSRSIYHDFKDTTASTTTTTKSYPIKRDQLYESDATITFKSGPINLGRLHGSDNNARNAERRANSIEVSACSSASSFSRSCLSKTNSSERDRLHNGVRRTVRFYPVSTVVGEDCRPCGHKRVCEEEEKESAKNSVMEKSRVVKEAAREFLEEYRRNNKKKNKNDDLVMKDLSEEEEDDDALSCASSDLFELDHMAVFGDDRYSEELPVYETTHVSTNRAIANGLIV